MPPGELYGEEYFSRDEYLDYKSQYPTLARNFDRYLQLMRQHGAGEGRLLEVGSAYGFFLVEARRFFEVEGIDVCAEAIAYGREQFGLNLYCADFREFETTRPYNVVCMWDTIEHLFHPREYLARARDLLVEGGHLFLTTGDIGSLLARFRGRKWRQIHPPTHLHYFSQATIRHLLERTGFRVMGIRRVGTYRDINNMLHGLSLFGRRQFVRWIAKKLVDRTGQRWAHRHLYVNLFDMMFVGGRKA